jgi:hypothetical protein
MKKTVFILVIALIFLLSSGSASIRCLHPQTPIFEEADFSSAVIFRIPQNAQVILVEDDIAIDNVVWAKVQYGSYVGYVVQANLYEEKNPLSFSISTIKATSRIMGEEIKLYSANSTSSAVIAKVKDGTKLNLVTSEIDYGDFYEISYNNQRVFIEKKYATTGLTYNQKTALIIGAVTLVSIVLMFFIINYIYKSKKSKAQ